jgi:DNA-binding GntR family transcriptional regulator
LQALAHDHIVTLAPHRGAFVSSPTIETARDIFAARKLVEAAIAREAARRIHAAQLAELRALLSTERAALNRSDRPAAPVIRSLSRRRRGDVRRRRSYRLPEKLDLAIVAGDRPLRT